MGGIPVLEGTHDRHRRPLGRRQRGNGLADVRSEAERQQQLLGASDLAAPADPPSSSGLVAAPEAEVVDRRQRRHEAEVLVDDADLLALGLAERPQVDGLAAELHVGAVVGPHVAGEQLDQRRLARAVLPDERMDLAGQDLERRPVEGHLTWIGLGASDVEDVPERTGERLGPDVLDCPTRVALGQPPRR